MDTSFTVVWIEHCSRYNYTPDSFSDTLIHYRAVHLGCAPHADPQVNSHMILVPLENLQKFCRAMSEFGQDAYMRVDSNGVAYLTDDAGRSWYTLQSCRGADENTPYVGPLKIHGAINKIGRHLGFLTTAAVAEVH